MSRPKRLTVLAKSAKVTTHWFPREDAPLNPLTHHRSIPVVWRDITYPVRVVDNFDGFLDAFAKEVDGNLTDERCPFGVLLWPSSRTLADTLASETPLPDVKLIVEMGCGVGFLACVLAKLYPDAQVIACDYEENLSSYVLANAQTFGVEDRVSFQKIDWRAAVPESLKGASDLVVGADVFYDDSHLTHLPPFAAKLLMPEGKLLLADPKRFRFSKALDDLKALFTLDRHDEVSCALDKEGIEEFMVGTGYKEQKISILRLTSR
ncbi:MAG: methyltransferase domain-containing protein [Chitinophagaceae bacterium]|nr:methyltransferase domain-containing protein [Oligoflexus sp.]